MGNKIAVVACSNACLDYFDHPYDIRILRSTLHLGDEDYLDYIDISAEDFYNRLESDKNIFPSSSYMPLGQMIELFEGLVKDGYNQCIVVSISANMSGIYNTAQIASRDVEGLETFVFDSKTVAYPQAKMALRACEMIEEGKEVPEILKELEYIRDNNNIYFGVHTLTYLVKNGRLSNASGFIGNAMKIKPILSIDKEGKVITFEKIRTFHKAMDRILELYFEETKGKDVETFIIHANNQETYDYMTQKIREERDPNCTPFNMPLTAVVGAHSGPKTIGLGYYIKKK
jgi:DegV family protein with EDD domain